MPTPLGKLKLSTLTKLPLKEMFARLIDGAAALCGLGCLLTLAATHIKFMTYPGPQEINEPASWYCTALLDSGRNPYVPQELPGATQFFGPFYSYVVLAFKPLFGVGYFGHRMVNLLCFAGVFSLVARFMRKVGAGWGIIFPSLSVLYWLVLDNIMITARPDALGWLFFAIGVFLPASRNYTPWSSYIGLACAVLAFQCKAYFALAGCVTLLGLFCLQSARVALWSAVAYFSALLISIGVTTWYFPLYFIEAFLMQRSMVEGNSSNEMGRVHDVLLLKRAWPFLLVLTIALCRWAVANVPSRWRRLRGGDLRAALPSASFEVLGAFLIICLLLVHFYMGKNGGASFTYHTHLLFPLMFVLTAIVLRGYIARIVAPIALAIFAISGLEMKWIPTDTAPYTHLADIIHREPGEIFGLAAAVEPLFDSNQRIYDDGFTAFLGFALGEGRAERMLAARVIEDRSRARDEELRRKVSNRQFSMIILETEVCLYCPIELIKENYQMVETFPMPTYFGQGPVTVWRPKPRIAPADSGGKSS